MVEIGDIAAGKAEVRQPPRGASGGVVYFKNNSGLAIRFVTPGAVLYRKLKAEGTAREIPSAWLGTDLSALYARAFVPRLRLKEKLTADGPWVFGAGAGGAL